jgi:hypothetical protein
MFTRVVCLMLIAAVVACPMWCTSGLCGAVQCHEAQFHDDQIHNDQCSVAQVCDQSSDLPECCRQKMQEQSDEAPGPCRCPDKAFCQGVCGGAVFEKPVELDLVAFSFFIAATDVEFAHVPQRIESRLHTVHHHWHSHGGNYGRSLRTLQMSFLL